MNYTNSFFAEKMADSLKEYKIITYELLEATDRESKPGESFYELNLYNTHPMLEEHEALGCFQYNTEAEAENDMEQANADYGTNFLTH